MRDEPWTPERQKRLFDELDRDKALEQIIKERRAKRDAQEEARLRGPALEDVADDDYLRSVIRDPDAGYWDDAARENNRRYAERFDVHADDHLPRGALIAEAVEVDRVAARPTKHIKSKKRGTARKASPKKPIREAAKVLRYAALNASLLTIMKERVGRSDLPFLGARSVLRPSWVRFAHQHPARFARLAVLLSLLASLLQDRSCPVPAS